MLKRTLLMLLLLAPPVSGQGQEEPRIFDNATVTKLVSSYEFGKEPGLYEVVSKTNGNTLYLYIDRAGNIQIAVADKPDACCLASVSEAN